MSVQACLKIVWVSVGSHKMPTVRSIPCHGGRSAFPQPGRHTDRSVMRKSTRNLTQLDKRQHSGTSEWHVTYTLFSVGLPLQDGWTPLHDAAWTGHKEAVMKLLGVGAVVNAPTKVGPPPSSGWTVQLHGA
jgi:hypothetical protein